MRRSALAILLYFSAVACAGTPARKEENGDATSTVTSEAAAGVKDPELAALLVRHWEDAMRRYPVQATRLGDHRYDDRIADNSPAALEDAKRARREFLSAARQLTESKKLDAGDAITLRLFIEDLQGAVDAEVCLFEEWTVEPRSTPLDWNDLHDLHPIKTVQDGENFIARYRAAPTEIEQRIAHLERGAKKGLYGNIESTKRVIAMIKTQLGQKVEDWPMMLPAKKDYPGWTTEEKTKFMTELRAAVEAIKPSIEKYLAFVEKELLPKARGDDKPGLAALPFAKVCYDSLIASYTTIKTTPEELHQTGRSEIERINTEMKSLGKKLFGTEDLGKILEKLRTDPKLYFTTAEEVEQKAQTALAAARAKMGDYFGILPKADCVVTRIPDYEAPYTTIAYYRQPVPDGSKPGQYFINVSAPKTRPRYEAEALAFHESIPGHHLQIAIAQELPALPLFRKHGGVTAFIEGWGLYTEQLSDEMGLYSGDLDRMGKLSYEAWRASRLVVDTGLHAMGWSRGAAKDYMLAHTALAANNIDNEVDRYINWPGQALAYKTGQLEILRLRKAAQDALGASFDIKAFHDVVLRNGAVSLPILRTEVEAWIARASAGQTSRSSVGTH